jgi:hypothetical protein
MFQAVPPPIIRSSKLYTQHRVFVELFLLLITNKMQRYTMVFITVNALHVSGGSSALHQELNIVYTASGICRAFSASYNQQDATLHGI